MGSLHRSFKRFLTLFLFVFLIFTGYACDDNGGTTFEPPTQRVADDAPLSSMVAAQLDNSFGQVALLPADADSIPDYVKGLVDEFAEGTIDPGINFPLENSTDDSLRAIDGLKTNVVISFLDPLGNNLLTTDNLYGAGNDYITYFGNNWDEDWNGNEVGSGPNFRGNPANGFLWSNFEYVEGFPGPGLDSAPVTTGAHITFANLLAFLGILDADPLNNSSWTQDRLDTYIENWKKLVGGGWFQARVNNASNWEVVRGAQNIRYDATDNTLLKITGYNASGATDDLGSPLPQNVVVGILSDCSGGLTPWGTVLSAEENVQFNYGDVETAWDSRQRFQDGEGWDPGAACSFPIQASSSSDFGRHSDPNQNKNRDHYGFLVEIDPGVNPSTFYTSLEEGGDGAGHRKIGSMGRARWENAAVVVDENHNLINGQHIVIYAGNDRRGGRVYKWVSAEPYEDGMTRGEVRALLDEGTTYVSHFENLNHATGTELNGGIVPTPEAPGTGKWIRMSVNNDEDTAPNAATLGAETSVGDALQSNTWNDICGFGTDQDVMTALYTAANKIGISELNRPEDVEWNPADELSGDPRLYIVFTNHTRFTALDENGVRWPSGLEDEMRVERGDGEGTIFAVEETGGDPGESTTFNYFRVFKGNSTETPGIFDVTRPDNMVIDSNGGLWFGTDGNFGELGTADAVYYLDLNPTRKAGEPGIVNPTYGMAFRVMAGPSDSEFTGPAFNSDENSFFGNIQHPGEEEESTWPPR